MDLTPTDRSAGRPQSLFDIHSIDPLIRPLIPYFSELTTERIRDLQTAIASRSLDQIKRLAHTIKGSAASYGFPQFAEIAARIEKAVNEPDPFAVVSALVERLAAAHDELVHMIQLAPELFAE